MPWTRSSRPSRPPPEPHTQLHHSVNTREGNGSLKLTWLGHSTVLIDLAGHRLLTDPLLLRHNGPLRRRQPRPQPALWTGVDAVLLSHLHHDHAEVRSLRLGPVPPPPPRFSDGRRVGKHGPVGRSAQDRAGWGCRLG